jgi:branched-chain amino acid transport system ATP-binding protein
MSQLSLKGVSKYFGGLAAIKDLDLEIDEGEIRGLIGPNGAGKTTIFNVITGELAPNSGEILYRGKPLNGLKSHQIAKMGIVRTYQLVTLFSGYSALENILVGFHSGFRFGVLDFILGARKSHAVDIAQLHKAMEILEFMGLSEFADAQAENLPHGLQRKLGVAIALAARAKILLLDEPLTGMNPSEALDMIQTIREIKKEYGTTIVLVEHNLQAVMELCERITVINFGHKIAEGDPESIRRDENVIEAYIGKNAHAT